jgi:hypothetical protein
MTALPRMVVLLERALERAKLPHAFGGAIALGYHVDEARGTRDIDLNIFVPSDNALPAFEALPKGVVWNEDDVSEVERDGQVRLFWETTPVDLFFTSHPFHERAAANAERVPFEGITMPILGANELAVFKAFFNRTRDWGDTEAMVDARTIDLHVVIGWIVHLRGPDDERVERLRALFDRPPPGDEPRFAP